MQHESNFWPGIYADLKSGLITWLLSIDPAALFTAAVVLACIYILRRKIARSLINIIASFFERLSVPLVDEIIERLLMPAQVLVVTFGFYLLFDSINLLDAGNGVLLRLLASVAIISVFATWYHLSGAFASVLRADSHSPVAVERDWIQRVTQFAIILLGVAKLIGFQIIKQLRNGKSSIGTQILSPQARPTIAFDDGVKQRLPIVGTMNIAWTQ